mmetsp:Transcript_29851/g.62798  ORF Transcript_29851/g.62798 Transcript_29851/m.62798 type:complete len:499 (-) Transcript_29851:18-1514(-)
MHPFQQGLSSHEYSVSHSGKNDNTTMPQSQNHQVRKLHHQYSCSNHSTKQVMKSPHPPLKKAKLCNAQGNVPHHFDSVDTPIRQFPIPPPPPPLPSPRTRASISSSASKASIAEAPTTTPAKKHDTKQSVVPSSTSISNDATRSSFSAPASTPVAHTSNASTAKTASSAKSSRPATPKPKPEGSGVMGKGLRHFSMKVCEKVEERGTTSYNEVADELVKELQKAEQEASKTDSKPKNTNVKSNTSETIPSKSKKYDEKNIRRRVYDALNVLMAMDIITKNKKQISWRGWRGNLEGECVPSQNFYYEDSIAETKSSPGFSNSINDSIGDLSGLSRQERIGQLQEERDRRLKEIRKKRDCLKELIAQNVCFRNLVGRNHARNAEASNPSFSNNVHQESKAHHNRHEKSSSKKTEDVKIPLPFIVVNTHAKAEIECEMCPQETNVSFDFSHPFEINDDNEILKRLGMNYTSKAALQRSLPPDLYAYCERHGLLQRVSQQQK